MLTLKQKLEDFEYFWRIMDNCFPVKGPAARCGHDWEAIKESSRAAIAESKDDLEFFRAVKKIDEDFKRFCHLKIFDPSLYESYRDMFVKFREGAWENEEARNALGPWIDPLFMPHSEKFYSAFENSVSGIYLKGEAPADEEKSKEKQEKLRFEIVEEGRIAYMYIRDLDMLRIPEDRPKIFAFLQEIKDYDHLIIDFRDNGGGATDYWQKLLVAPTIKEPLSICSYMGANVNEYNQKFFAGYEQYTSPISELPKLPNLVPEDIAALTHFTEASYTVKPDPENRGFTGKIWMLVSKRVYSSAESFAVFARHSGWATLVGTRTGGDGIGVTPQHHCLPNSGIVWRISGIYGINPDGSSNQECCTDPHIECEAAKAYDVCLEEIKKEYK